MENLAKAIGRFLTRDIFYVLSGLYLLAASHRSFGIIETWSAWKITDSNTSHLIILLGSAYVLGFVLKEIFAFLGITIEAHHFEPNWLEIKLYERHQRKPWKKPNEFVHEHVYKQIAAAGPEVQSRYDRISDMVHLCSTTGTAITVSGIILLFHNPSEALVGIIGLVLIAMSRFQSMRRMLFLSEYA